MSQTTDIKNYRVFEIRNNYVEELDKLKREHVAFTGIALTEYGTLFGSKRFNWNFIGRYAMCGK
jgi:hypothetical protein